ncbi:sulfite exporter TauE/SafE family protein [Anaerobacillus sp. CMMVII]|uniref:cytochrome c biogenesis CcdA family protein n=1 Tax=Anaerobacillus sp. CMMVII TaxID=2755588 RepID=UPI0021C4E4EE|nr:cytochrome c biogenesis protein CcdA [Anaerobacillus sp. CMMVII]MCT8139508.1 sulfite exporter TauE/SafE family protein [Anaerobacillus sp. CMMVII]
MFNLVITEFTFISIWLALFAGIISFLSPCVFPLVPAYLAQLTGTQISNNQLAADKKLIISRSIGFIIGFTIIFLLLGASSTFFGQIFMKNRELLEKIGGIVIVVLGLQMLGLFSIKMLMSEKRLQTKPKKSTSFLGSVMFGFVFGAGWSPCIGLALSSILILAAQSGTMASGMFLLFVYSIGMGIPFLIVALIYSRSLNKIRKMNKFIPMIQKISGGIMVLLGILLYTGLFARLSGYLAQYIPFNF